MGQFMEALNSQTNLDDLNLNIDSFQGGLECNVDEVSARKYWNIRIGLEWHISTFDHILFITVLFSFSHPTNRSYNKNWTSTAYSILIYHFQINTLDLI